MNYNSFTSDLWVQYQEWIGKIKFVSNRYITICINPEVNKEKQTHILIFPENWNQVSLLKESRK